MSYHLLAGCLILLCTLGGGVSTAKAESFNLPDQTWEMLVIPADASELSIESLFGNELSLTGYGSTWVVYAYDSTAGLYNSPGLSETLPAGQAFWMIQATGDLVEVVLPDTLSPAMTNPGLACIENAECVSVPLASSASDISWTQVGIPLGELSAPSEFLFVNGVSGFSCSDGCTLQQAIDAQHIAGPLWLYDSSVGLYADANSVDEVLPGQGFWFATLPAAAGSAPALHVPGVPSPSASTCRYFVSPQGSDSNDGRTQATAFETTASAIALLQAGDTVCLMEGSYPAPIVIDGKIGSEAQPIIVQALPGSEGQVVVQDVVRSLQTGIEVSNSSHVHVMNLTVRHVLRGIQFNSVTGGSITGNLVIDIEQEAIRVGALSNASGLAGGPSSNVRIEGNTINNTGIRPGSNASGTDYADFGEGIYVGTGKYTGDDTHDIVVNGNVLSNTTADSIEIKPYTYNITVSNNIVSNSVLPYAGAISIAIGPEATQNGNYLVEGNVVHQIQSRRFTVAGIVVGQGNAVVRNNTVWAIEGGRGIRVYTTFMLPGADSVLIEDNTVWHPDTQRSIVIHDGDGGFDLDDLAIVLTDGNITDDGSGDSEQVNATVFVGPVTGDADSGSGPGSGFVQNP